MCVSNISVNQFWPVFFQMGLLETPSLRNMTIYYTPFKTFISDGGQQECALILEDQSYTENHSI